MSPCRHGSHIRNCDVQNTELTGMVLLSTKESGSTLVPSWLWILNFVLTVTVVWKNIKSVSVFEGSYRRSVWCIRSYNGLTDCKCNRDIDFRNFSRCCWWVWSSVFRLRTLEDSSVSGENESVDTPTSVFRRNDTVSHYPVFHHCQRACGLFPVDMTESPFDVTWTTKSLGDSYLLTYLVWNNGYEGLETKIPVRFYLCVRRDLISSSLYLSSLSRPSYQDNCIGRDDHRTSAPHNWCLLVVGRSPVDHVTPCNNPRKTFCTVYEWDNIGGIRLR